MESHPIDVLVSFAGAFVGTLAFGLALLDGDAGPALAAFVMATGCGAEFVARAAF